MAFTFAGGTNTQNTSTNGALTRTVSTPGLPGDAQFLWAAGRASDDLADYDDPPGGWTRVGGMVRFHNPSLGTRPYAAVQVWWRIAPASSYSSETITKVAHTNSRFRGGAFTYESDSGETASIRGTPQIDTTGSTNSTTFTPANYTTPRGLVLCNVWRGPDLAGFMNDPTTPNGFVEDADYASDDPQGVTVSQEVTSSPVSMPTWTFGSATAWGSLTFTINPKRQARRGLGMIVR